MSSVTPRPPLAAVFSDPGLPQDGRQSAAALEIQRGVARLLLTLGCSSITELPLANGRRADVVALSEKGDIWIIEVKSSIEDFRADAKWPEYADYCDCFYFAVAPKFPVDILPETEGLIFADRYGAEIVREAAETRLAPARRKELTLRFARAAAQRLQFIADPDARVRFSDAL